MTESISEEVPAALCKVTPISVPSTIPETLCNETQLVAPDDKNLSIYQESIEVESTDVEEHPSQLDTQNKSIAPQECKSGVFYEILTASGDDVNYIHHDDIVKNQPSVVVQKLDILQVKAAGEVMGSSSSTSSNSKPADKTVDNASSSTTSSDFVQVKKRHKSLRPRKRPSAARIAAQWAIGVQKRAKQKYAVRSSIPVTNRLDHDVGMESDAPIIYDVPEIYKDPPKPHQLCQHPPPLMEHLKKIYIQNKSGRVKTAQRV